MPNLREPKDFPEDTYDWSERVAVKVARAFIP
jgi:hypothetical protein